MRIPPPPPDRRKQLLVGALAAMFIGPWVVGSFFMTSLDPRFRSLPGGIFFCAFGAACLVAALWPPARRKLQSQDSFLGRHARIGTALFFLLGFGGVVIAIPDLLDWTAEPDVVTTVIQGTTTTWRGRQTIYAPGRSYDVATFWHVNVRSGAATLTLGHYSRNVLVVEQ